MKRSFRDRWERGFTALCKFHARKGHCCPSQRHIERGFRLGQWVSVQRFYKNSLSVERKRRLDKLGFVWSWIEYRWEKGFAALLNFKRRVGHCRVPRQDREGKFRLGLWVSTQRKRKYKLSAERRARLNKIGFVWKGQPGRMAY
jgi:hypothetical protein